MRRSSGAKGAIRKRNRTDNDSAKLATSKGVIQGYTSVAAVGSAHQIIVEAQAHGTGSRWRSYGSKLKRATPAMERAAQPRPAFRSAVISRLATVKGRL
jgi:hypothetical protein